MSAVSQLDTPLDEPKPFPNGGRFAAREKPFWRLLGAARPGWQEQSRWLREHGQELHDYDPEGVLAKTMKAST